MTRMDTELLLRPHRKALVIAAETVVRDPGAELPEKTQLNRLVSICGEATCAEEIANYLRYQASRKTAPWPRSFAELVIAKIEAPLQELRIAMPHHDEATRDRTRVAAWRLYAVFLTRAFTYAIASRAKKGNDHDRARR
jgi:hypothetical protein